jgi:hypothetical protein
LCFERLPANKKNQASDVMIPLKDITSMTPVSRILSLTLALPFFVIPFDVLDKLSFLARAGITR